MADIELVIKIPEKTYVGILEEVENKGILRNITHIAVANGTPLPKGHGDLVDRDKVIDLLNEQEYNYYTELDKVCDTVYEAPAIIEADNMQVFWKEV